MLFTKRTNYNTTKAYKSRLLYSLCDEHCGPAVMLVMKRIQYDGRD